MDELANQSDWRASSSRAFRLSAVMAAFAQPARLCILSQLAWAGSEGLRIESLAQLTGWAKSTIEQHLRILEREGLVGRRGGRGSRRIVAMLEVLTDIRTLLSELEKEARRSRGRRPSKRQEAS